VTPRWFTCLQTVTHSNNNCGQYTGTLLIEINAVTTIPCHYPTRTGIYKETIGKLYYRPICSDQMRIILTTS